jgi:hypothetical protein
MSDQFIRKVSLVVAEGEKGLDLSKLRIQFSTSQSDFQTPNTAIIRIYNLSDQTAARVETEFSRVILQAGYESGNFGIIFDGTIKQTRKGRENATDTYVDIFAADGDIPYNFGLVSHSRAAGVTPKEDIAAIAKSMNLPVGYLPDLTPAAAARGKVRFGLGRDMLRDICTSAGASWSIQNGKLVVIPLTGYLPGEAVVLNSATGMIGIPEVTEGGIRVRCLINSRLQIGGLIQLNSADIRKAFLNGTWAWSPQRLEAYTGILPKVLPGDGFYKVYVLEYSGDTRGQDWYADIVCLAVSPSAAPADSVNPFA